MIIHISRLLFIALMCASIEQVLAGEFSSGGSLSPEKCRTNVITLIQPIYPRHTKVEPWCRVTVDFEVQKSGQIEAPYYPDDVDFEDLRKVAQIEPEECSNRYIGSVLRSLRKAEFVASQEVYQCTYTYNWVLEP